MLKSRFWEQNFFFMDTGIRMGLVRISQQWIEDARLNHTVTSISLIPHWQKPVNLCAWMITKKTECLPWIIAIIPYVSQFFWEIPKIVEIPVFAGHPSTSCNTWLNWFYQKLRFLQFFQCLEKSQSLLDTLLPPVPLDLISNRLQT